MYKFRNLRFSPQQDEAKSIHDAERHFRYLEEATQNGVNMIQAPDVWKSSNRSPSPIKICVVDTGYDLGHVDLPQEDSGITYTQTGFGSALRDGDGHGTHCAGVIGAVGNNKEGVIGGKWFELFVFLFTLAVSFLMQNIYFLFVSYARSQ